MLLNRLLPSRFRSDATHHGARVDVEATVAVETTTVHRRVRPLVAEGRG